MKPAPKDVSWGTTNTPEKDRIDPAAKYKTRDGRDVEGLHIVLANSAGNEATFPVKGSIVVKGKKPVFEIWTLDGRNSLFALTDLDLVRKNEESDRKPAEKSPYTMTDTTKEVDDD
jgi:hypothetical protein